MTDDTSTTVAETENRVRLTLRLPSDLHDRVWEEALEHSESINNIIIEAVRDRYKGGR